MKPALLLFAAAALLPLFPAPAQQAPEARLIVTHSDLDLTSERGVRLLDRRLRSAVALACGPVSDADPQGRNRVRSCRERKMAEARTRRDIAIAGQAGEGKTTQVATRR